MPLTIGTRLGPYEIVALLGAGGMGEVYRARDIRLDRMVAIKVLLEQLASDPQFRERFDREARVISQLDHPHICALYDVGEQHGTSYLVMPYLEGETLADRIVRGALPIDEALTIAIQVADALDKAHQAGIFHRDLKPANIFLCSRGPRPPLPSDHGELRPGSPTCAEASARPRRSSSDPPNGGSPKRSEGGTPARARHPADAGGAGRGRYADEPVSAKLLDFGLAKTSAPIVAGTELSALPTMLPTPTAQGTILGTLQYMAPEQLEGRDADARTDIFAFGVVLHEMISGRKAFEARTQASLIAAILERQPPPLTDAPPELQRLVSRCLEKEAGRRYASARDVVGDLKRLKTEASEASAAGTASRSIAVLPFVNMSADPENEYFCDGIAEELINALTKIEQLRVVARTSAFSFKGKGGDLRAIGRTLNVSTVLEGSVRKAGSRLRITAQLVNVADGYHLWSDHYDRQLEDVFAIQDEISMAIVNALKVKLLGEEKAALARRHTENVEAYQLYLRGRHHWHKWNEEGFRRAKECLERAIQIDPDYALAYFGLADVYLAMGAMGVRPYQELLPEAKAALRRALALDQDLAEAWTLMAVAHSEEWDWAAAERAVARAIELNPRLAQAQAVLGLINLWVGRCGEGLVAAKRAVELDPLGPLGGHVLVEAHVACGDPDGALECIPAMLDIDPSLWLAHFDRGMLIAAQGKVGEAIQAFEEAVRYSGGGPHAVGYLVCALAMAGERDRAERELAGLVERAKERYVPPLSLAFAYLGLGPTDRVFECLERAFNERDVRLRFHAAYDPMFADLRRDPRMIDLLHRMGLPAVPT